MILRAHILQLKHGHALISDFGLARLKDSAEDSARTKTEVGPVKWEAPEAFLKHEYSRKSDVFSFGVVIYEIVTRGDPWPELNSIMASHEVVKGNR